MNLFCELKRGDGLALAVMLRGMKKPLRYLLIGLACVGTWLAISKGVVDRQVEERRITAAVPLDRGSRELKGSGLTGHLLTSYDFPQVRYKFTLDGEPYPVGKQGFVLLDARGSKMAEQAFGHHEFKKISDKEWAVEGLMKSTINPKTYEAVTDWMIGVIPP